MNFIFNSNKNNLQKLTILNSTFQAPTMPSPRRTRSQKGKTLLPEYVDDDDFDNFINNFDNDNEEKCMEHINNSMKNATVSDNMRTVTLHFDQLWKTFGLCHVWPQKFEGMLASTMDNCVD